MSVFESVIDDTVRSWVLVYFVDSDPGKEFEILARTRVSLPEDVPMLPKLKVKVFYGKAKIEAYVVCESNNYYYLQNNMKQLTADFTEDMIRSNLSQYRKEPWENGVLDAQMLAGDTLDENETALQKRYDCLKTKVNDLYSIQREMWSTIKVLMERIEHLTDRPEKAVQNVPTPAATAADDPDGETPRTTRKRRVPSENEEDIEEKAGMVYFGTNGTKIPKTVFDSINWSSCSVATRKLLVAVFSRDVLATHSLTGKPSPAFLNAGKALKEQLDPLKTADIIEIVTRRCNVSASTVRGTITTKCADENKMCKKRKLKVKAEW